jgi:glycolate oxidase FAD binding subunit
MTSPSIESFQATLAEIVGAEYVRVASPTDAIDLLIPYLVVAPADPAQTAAVLHAAQHAAVSVIPRGGGTKLGWGNCPRAAQIVLDLHRQNQVLEHAWGDMTATVQAGCTVAAFQQHLAAHGQRLALDPLFAERSTIGGMLATNESGAWRVRYGSLRDQVIGMTVALADGTLAKSGGKVVKNVAGYDLPKLMTGALGTLGVIVEATFRLYPLALDTRHLRVGFGDPIRANRALLGILDSVLAPAAIQLCLAANQPVQLDCFFEGLPAALDSQQQQLAQIVGALPLPGDPAIWQAREALWSGSEPALVAKVAVLPADIARLAEILGRVAEPLKLHWHMVINGMGVGMLRLEAANDEALLAALMRLRSDLAAMNGTVVALGCPASIKGRIDIWGEPSDALPLMRRVKERFDPQQILNPGRYVGGI